MDWAEIGGGVKRSIDLRWLFDPVLLFILRWWICTCRSNWPLVTSLLPGAAWSSDILRRFFGFIINIICLIGQLISFPLVTLNLRRRMWRPKPSLVANQEAQCSFTPLSLARWPAMIALKSNNSFFQTSLSAPKQCDYRHHRLFSCLLPRLLQVSIDFNCKGWHFL